MLLKLLLLFTLVPLVELILLLMIGQLSGHMLWSVAIVLITGCVGAWLARWQGLNAIQRIREQLAAGAMPTESLMDGAFILVAGAFLLTPGVLTDAVGMSMMVPACRRWYKARLTDWIKGHFQIASMNMMGGASNMMGGAAAAPNDDDGVIDSHVVREGESEPLDANPSDSRDP